jgi:RND family efflux transporter MFP subunit
MIAGKVEAIKKDVNSYVKEDDIIITVPNDVPASKFQQAKEAFELAQTTYERMQKLYEKGAISKQDLDQTETQYRVSESDFNAVSKTINVEAPISGKIGVMYAEVGNEVSPGTKLFKIVDDSRYKVRINVPENMIMQVEKGQKATASWNNIELEGRVDKVSSSLDNESNSFLVDLVFKNAGQNIKTGVTAEVRLSTYDNHAVVINEQYIIKTLDGSYVYLAKDSKAVKTEITLGSEFSGRYEVINGIDENDVLITEGSKLVQPNALVKIIR